ncbi:hypothetical protein L6164_036581 [Bauhinia variegata]|uniref:Uncharacterized protein n=1 Tax=Bauhinia variegata TaxID=167791 RepID=A0ACB9KI99_BAUVA|nr:hypothetical protein L6164_036581 [Bauhinia variegata]
MAINIIGAVAGVMSCLCAQNCLHESLAHQFRHLRKRKKNFDKLKSFMEELDARKVELYTKLELMWLEKGMEPKPGVKLWLRNADKIEGEVCRIISQIEQEDESLGSCFFCSRIKIGKLLEEKIREVMELLERGQFSDNSLAESLPKRGHALPTIRLMKHGTTIESLTKVWELLWDDRVRKLGVYGMGGVGKTTIMKVINNRLLQLGRHFDCVIWITVPKEINLENLQRRIAEKVGTDLSEIQDETTRAAALFQALKRRKRFLLILDDLWESFSLDIVGIPIPTRENGCKLVLTTRLLSVCRGMETDQDIKVNILKEDEAWNLFKNKAGSVVMISPYIRSIAKAVAKECMGLPLGIVTVGRALRKVVDVFEWENALAELRGSTANIGNLEQTVLSQLKFSFTRLKDDISRSCFLFCALYPEGHLIDTNELIEYWMWEGLLGTVQRISLSKRKGKHILNELIYACLLETETQNGMECAKMHDLIIDMAITIMNVRPRCIAKAGIGLNEPPEIHEWAEDVQRVSLMRNDLKSIPPGYHPRCPGLTSLLLQCNSFPKGLNDLFDFIPNLKVLDLSYTGIESLPESLSELVELHSLVLSNYWNLRVVPSLAKLSKLIVLDLSFSRNVNELPHGTEQLKNLRRLNISNTRIRILPSGLLSELAFLEELLTCNSDVFWGGTLISTSAGGGASIEEVIFSLGLSHLEVDFWNHELYDLYYRSDHWVQLYKFKFIVGVNQAQEHLSEERGIAFNEIFLRPRHLVIPTNTVELQLFDCSGVTELTTPFCRAKQLKKCIVVQCPDIECITDPAQNDLSMLEKMELRLLGNLQMICRGMVTLSTLTNLKTIKVEFCPNLNYLFSGKLVLQLKNLEEINVNHCHSMEDVIRWEEEGNIEDAKIHLRRLKMLKLEFMPRLKSIYNGFICANSLGSIEIITCDELRRLPLNPDDAEGIPPAPLLEIKGTNYWWQSLEWDEPAAKETMQAYFTELPMVSNHVGSSSQAGSTFHDTGNEYLLDSEIEDIIEDIEQEFIQDILSRP